MDLSGKKVLITGAAKRIGAAIAEALAKKGCHLILHYHRSAPEAKALQCKLSAFGISADLIQADLSQEKEVAALAKTALKKGPVDILINNTSLFYPIPFEKLKVSDWDQFMNVNLKALFILSQKLGLKMIQKGGHIINLADLAGCHPYRNYLPYCVSKGAVLSLTRALAIELAPKVQVNSICPGLMIPPPWLSEPVKNRVIKKSPLKKWGGVEEIAKGVLFLCESDYITGSELVIDGGRQLV